MKKKCDTCAHFEICKSWTQANYRCGLYEAVPPVKVGGLLYVPVYDALEDEKWYIDILPITDVGQRFIYCPQVVNNPDDTSDSFAIDRIGVDVFATIEEAEAFVKAVERGSKR